MLAIAAALLLATCSFLPGRQFAFGFPADGAVPELRGVLTDKTGNVVKVTTIQKVDPAPPIDRGMMTFADRPTSVMAHWIGGACDESIAIEVTPDGGATITVSTIVKPVACEGIGIPRYVMIELSAPPDLSRTTIRFAP